MNKKEFLVLVLVAVASALGSWNLNNYLGRREVSSASTFASEATIKLVKGDVAAVHALGGSDFKDENDVEGLSEYLKVISDLPDDSVILTSQVTEGDGSFVVTNTLPAGEEVRVIVLSLAKGDDGLAITNVFAQ